MSGRRDYIPPLLGLSLGIRNCILDLTWPPNYTGEQPTLGERLALRNTTVFGWLQPDVADLRNSTALARYIPVTHRSDPSQSDFWPLGQIVTHKNVADGVRRLMFQTTAKQLLTERALSPHSGNEIKPQCLVADLTVPRLNLLWTDGLESALIRITRGTLRTGLRLYAQAVLEGFNRKRDDRSVVTDRKIFRDNPRAQPTFEQQHAADPDERAMRNFVIALIIMQDHLHPLGEGLIRMSWIDWSCHIACAELPGYSALATVGSAHNGVWYIHKNQKMGYVDWYFNALLKPTARTVEAHVPPRPGTDRLMPGRDLFIRQTDFVRDDPAEVRLSLISRYSLAQQAQMEEPLIESTSRATQLHQTPEAPTGQRRLFR